MKKQTKKLALMRETLSDLSSSEMKLVVGQESTPVCTPSTACVQNQK
jgi:hypothetical protein